MSSINRARLVNIHFNGGERVIGNKMLDFHGESLLILLKNGGGKTVMIQLLTAPMMHRKTMVVRIMTITKEIPPPGSFNFSGKV